MGDLTPETMASLISERLAKLDMSQAEFARKVGASPKHVNLVLNGRSHASLTTLDYWAFVLGMRWSVRLVKR